VQEAHVQDPLSFFKLTSARCLATLNAIELSGRIYTESLLKFHLRPWWLCCEFRQSCVSRA